MSSNSLRFSLAVSLTAFESPRGEFTEVAVPAPAAAITPAKTEEKAPVAA